jgi:hypothetical protein
VTFSKGVRSPLTTNRIHRLSFADRRRPYAGSDSGIGQTFRKVTVSKFETVYKDLQNITRELMLRLIENETNSAFIFAATARTAYRAAEFSEGNAALSKAEAIYVQASELARDGGVERDQATAERISELRAVIDVLARAKRGMDQ